MGVGYTISLYWVDYRLYTVTNTHIEDPGEGSVLCRISVWADYRLYIVTITPTYRASERFLYSAVIGRYHYYLVN